LKKLLATDGGLDATVLRIVLGGVILPHGLQKTLGLFGGPGFGASVDMFTQDLGLPHGLAVTAIVGETLAAAALVVGLLTRLAALGVLAVMVGAIVLVHAPHGFFMNWSGQQQGEGFEYHLLAIGMALALVIRGGGAASLDRSLWRRSTER